MSKKKKKSVFITGYLLLLIGITLIMLTLTQSLLRSIVVVVLSVIGILPVLIASYQIKEKAVVITAFTSLMVIFGAIAIFFRRIRDSLPPPIIDGSGIIGYTQFFGYPFFLDTVLFFILLLLPFFVLFLWYIVKKHRTKLIL